MKVFAGDCRVNPTFNLYKKLLKSMHMFFLKYNEIRTSPIS